jgi:hypothetical protein
MLIIIIIIIIIITNCSVKENKVCNKVQEIKMSVLFVITLLKFPF